MIVLPVMEIGKKGGIYSVATGQLTKLNNGTDNYQFLKSEALAKKSTAKISDFLKYIKNDSLFMVSKDFSYRKQITSKVDAYIKSFIDVKDGLYFLTKSSIEYLDDQGGQKIIYQAPRDNSATLYYVNVVHIDSSSRKLYFELKKIYDNEK